MGKNKNKNKNKRKGSQDEVQVEPEGMVEVLEVAQQQEGGEIEFREEYNEEESKLESVQSAEIILENPVEQTLSMPQEE